MSIVTKFFSTLLAPGPTPFVQRFNGAIQTAAVSLDKWVASSPAASALVSDALTDVKQGTSTALALADSDLGPYLATATAAFETALDTFVTAAATKVAGPAGTEAAALANPFFNAGVSQAFQVFHSLLTKAETDVKAWAASPS